MTEHIANSFCDVSKDITPLNFTPTKPLALMTFLTGCLNQMPISFALHYHQFLTPQSPRVKFLLYGNLQMFLGFQKQIKPKLQLMNFDQFR